MESPREFTTRALNLENDAIALSRNCCGDNTELNRWRVMAKHQVVTWVGGLAFALKMMSASSN